MNGETDDLFRKALGGLRERAKELRCLYAVEELLQNPETPPEEVFEKLLKVIPSGWQYTTVCEPRILYEGKQFFREDFIETEWMQAAEINIDGHIAGEIQVYYTQFIRLVGDSQFLPEEQHLLNTIADRVSRFIFNQRLRKIIMMLSDPQKVQTPDDLKVILTPFSDEHWKWRYRTAQVIASRLDMKRFGAKAIYLIGSAKNATCGPESDIDLMIHFDGTESQRDQLLAWIEGWSYCLGYINQLKTGHKIEKLIDLHLVSDSDIERKTSFAVLINGVENRARLLRKI